MRKTFTLLAVFIVIASFGALFAWSNQPSKGTIVSTGQEGVEVRGASTTLESFKSSLFLTKVPSNLKMKTKSEIPDSAIIGQYLLVDKNPYVSDQLAITVGSVKSPDVSEISPVQFRKTFSQEYEVVPTDSSYPDGSIVFVKKAGYEKSVFWVDDEKYVGIVVSGGVSRSAELNQTLHSAVTNWAWL